MAIKVVYTIPYIYRIYFFILVAMSVLVVAFGVIFALLWLINFIGWWWYPINAGLLTYLLVMLIPDRHIPCLKFGHKR